MQYVIMLNELDQEVLANTLLEYAAELKPLPEDVPFCLNAFDLPTLRIAAFNMEKQLNDNKRAGSDVLFHLYSESNCSGWRKALEMLPNNYEIKVYPLPVISIGLIYDKETLNEFFKSRTK